MRVAGFITAIDGASEDDLAAIAAAALTELIQRRGQRGLEDMVSHVPEIEAGELHAFFEDHPDGSPG